MNHFSKLYYDLPLPLRQQIHSLRKKGRLYRSPRLDQIEKHLEQYLQKKLLFIHIPKAAGCSIHQALFNSDAIGHFTIDEFRKVTPGALWNSLYTFSFVRNPFDRTLSAYSYLSHGGRKKGEDLEYQRMLSDFPTFERFVLRWLAVQDVSLIEHFRPQHTYICDRKGRVLVDYVGRFETLEDDFGELCQLRGLQCELPIENKTKSKTVERYQTAYTPEMREVIEDVYGDDLKIFDYSFDEPSV